jgi:hypothetical protein
MRQPRPCPQLALNGLRRRIAGCPLSGEERTSNIRGLRSAFDAVDGAYSPASECHTIGLDIAKSVFQVHGVDDAGAVVIHKRVSRAKVLEFFAELPRCLIGIEACPASALVGVEGFVISPLFLFRLRGFPSQALSLQSFVIFPEGFLRCLIFRCYLPFTCALKRPHQLSSR